MRYLLMTIAIAATLTGCGDDGDPGTQLGPETSTPLPATFVGLSATVNNEVIDPLTGTVGVRDRNPDETTIVAQSDVAFDYGTFSIGTNGDWTYTLDTSNPAVAALRNVAETLTETIVVTSADGTTADLVITITGVGESTLAARMTDNSTADNGELRLRISDLDITPNPSPLLAGKLNVSFNKDDNTLGSDGNVKDAYITLYNTSTSTSSGRAILDLRIRSNRFTIRDFDPEKADLGDTKGDITVTNEFTPGEWQELEVTWDYQGGAVPILNILIDGVPVTTSPYEGSDNAVGGVTHVAFRFSDTSSTTLGAFKVDNIEIYSDTAGTNLIFEDDFEGNNEDDVLGPPKYHSNTFEAVVAVVALDSGDEPLPPEPAQFIGELTGSIVNDATADLTGTITVQDRNPGEDTVQAQTGEVGDYGTFSITPDGANGNWTYTLDIANPAVAALVDNTQSLTETITITSADSTTTNLVITIRGPVPASTGTTQVANVTDVTAGDTGELRYNLASHSLQGKVTFNFFKTDNFAEGGSNKDAFFSLYGPSTSSTNYLVDLRIKSSTFLIDDTNIQPDYNTAGGSASEISTTFTPDQWYAVEINWDVTQANQVQVLINGVDIAGGYFLSPAAIVNGDPTAYFSAGGGVEGFQFRSGSGSTVIDSGAFYVDDIKVYSDTAGTTLVYEEDFEAPDWNVGDPLDTPDFHSNSNDAEVASVDATGKPGVTTQVANVTDVTAGDTGELRYNLASHSLQGKVTFNFFKTDNFAEGGSNKDAFFSLYGPSTSSTNYLVDLRIKSSTFLIDDTNIQPDYNTAGGSASEISTTFTPDQWYAVEINWDVTQANQVQVLINGVDIAGGYFLSPAAIVNGDPTAYFSAGGGVEGFQFRSGSGSTVIDSGAFYVDDIKVYSDTAGTTLVYEEDFEAPDWNVGDPLDTPDFHSNSNDAEVASVDAGGK